MSTLGIDYFNILKDMVTGEDGYYFVTKAKKTEAAEAKKKAEKEGKQPPIGKPGELLKKLPLDEALKKLRQKLEEDAPDRDHLPEALEAFRKIEAYGNSPKDFHPSYENDVKEMQRRYDYSAQCRNSLLKCYATRIQQYQRWDQIVRDHPEIEPGTGSHRWRERLLRADNTPEAHFHNERVVMLSALKDRKISEMEFKNQRYQAYLGAGKTKKEARRLAKEEFENPADCLMELFQNRINETIARIPQIKAAFTDVLNGTARDLDAAYRLVEDDGIYLMMNSADAVEELKGDLKNFAAREKDIKKQVKEWDTLGCTMLTTQEFVEDVANPHYAYLDPRELQKINVGFLQLEPEDPLSIYTTAVHANMLKEEIYGMESTLNKYGFKEGANENLEGSGIMVYHRDGKSLVFPVESTEWKNGQLQFHVNEKAPGRLVDKNLDQDVAHYQAELDKLGVNAQSPMAGIGSALAALKDVQLGDDPEEKTHRDVTKKFENLKEVAEFYLTAPEAEPQKVKLVKNLKSFADVKLKQLADVRSHQNLVMMNEAVIDNAQRDATRTKQAMFDVWSNAEIEAERNVVRQYKQSGKKSRSGMANQKIDEYIKNKWKNYVTEKAAAKQHKDIDDFATENDGICKQILAAQVVQSLVVNEKFPSADSQRVMQEYVISGKLDNLVHMVWNSESFCDQVRCLDLSNRADAEKLMKDGLPKQVAKDIMKNVLQAKRQDQPANGNPQNAANNNPLVLNYNNQPKVIIPR